jgi:FKBP-type peptidyl-prolyl cis-trans isomerase
MKQKHSMLFLAMAIVLGVFSCKEQRIPGFRKMGNGSWFKLITLGESDRRPKEGEYMELVLLNKFADSVLYDSRLENSRGTILAPYNEKDGFSRLREGDSAVFLVPAYDLAQAGNDSMMHMNVKLVHILDEKQYKAESEIRNHADEMDEQRILNYFFKTRKEKFQELTHGLYYLDEKTGNGREVKRGDRVLVNYQGTFLNGKKFDAPDEPVEYTMGDEGQMLDGMAIGLAHMKEGGKAKFIIPSHLAYGATGSSTGIIKPFTTITYEVELMKVN